MYKVSVIIPAFNTREFIGRALASVQAQTLQDFEILVVDDASVDGTPDYVISLAEKDARIKLIASEKNGGPSVARNKGLEAAQGEWIALLDADDAYKPERLAAMVRTGEDHALDFVFDNIIIYDGGLRRELGPALPKGHDNITRLTLADFIENDMPDAQYPYGALKPLIRRACLDTHNIRYTPKYRFGEDFLLAAEFLAHGARAALMAEGYYVYTMSVGPVSRQRSAHCRITSDYSQILEAMEDFIARHGARLDSRTLAALNRRTSAYRPQITLDRLRRLRAEKNYAGMLRFLLTSPSVWSSLYRRVVKK